MPTRDRSADRPAPEDHALLHWITGVMLVLATFFACAAPHRSSSPEGNLDPAMARVLDELAKLGPKPIETLTPAAARCQPSPADAALQVMQRNGELSPEPAPAVGRIETRLVPGSGGVSIPARLYVPAGAGPFPIVVYFHGGGFVLATIDTYDATCRGLCARVGAIVVAVEYRKAPEHRFPTAHEDCYAALQHVLANAADFGGDGDRVAVAGESAGGNLATAACLMALDRRARLPKHQLLVYPVVGSHSDSASYRVNAFAKPLNAKMMDWFYGHYLRTPADRENPLVAPIVAPIETLRAMPPATVITAEIDPLRSEGRAYAHRLDYAGVDVEARDYTGVTHEFFGLAAVVPDGDAAQEFAAERLRAAFGTAERPSVAPRRDPRANPVAVVPASAGGSGIVAPTDTPIVRGGPAQGKHDERLEEFARFRGPAMPTGVAVTKSERVFVCFPRWGDAVPFTVAEVQNGRLTPFPDAATNEFDAGRAVDDPTEALVSVQSVHVDERDTLWLLDSGCLEMGPVIAGAPKLCAYEADTGRRVRCITFPNDVVLKRTYLNDVRIDRQRGRAGTAFVTDSGVGGIVVIDLDSGRSWRRLDGVAAVLPTPGLVPSNEGERFVQRKDTGEETVPDIRSDGLALSADGETVFFTPLVGRDLWAVPADLLADPDADPQQVAAAVRKVATKPSANDGLECDRTTGVVYSTDWEDAAIRTIDPASGAVEVLVQDQRLIWPDSLALANGHLWIMTNQLARQPRFHAGSDLRSPPYQLFRIRLDRR